MSAVAAVITYASTTITVFVDDPYVSAAGKPVVSKRLVMRDWIQESITLKRGLTGAKPEAFCRWVLDLLGYIEGDEVEDVFPGSGVMGHVLAQGRLA